MNTPEPKPQFICFLEPSRPEMPDALTPEEAETIGQHFSYYQSLHQAGKLILAGRTLNQPYSGIMIFEAEDVSSAQQIVDADPAVQSGTFKASLQPYSVALMRQ